MTEMEMRQFEEAKLKAKRIRVAAEIGNDYNMAMDALALRVAMLEMEVELARREGARE